jgi:hypothetical protein
MKPTLGAYTGDFRRIVAAAADAAGFANPVAFDPDEFQDLLLKKAARGRFIPLDGVLIRDWDPDWRRYWAGMNFGLRLYHLENITFVRACTSFALDTCSAGYDFFLVDRKDYLRLYRIGAGIRRASKKPGTPPVMPAGHSEVLWSNTIGFLDPANLRRIKDLGGRARRGLLLSGPPGNGKTTACRWIFRECRRRNWDCRIVTADDYQSARRDDDPGEAVRRLFRVSKRGVVFFDDMDIALRDRNTVNETDDQSVFLTAMDGVEVHEGVVYVFTTNCSLDLIDAAFRRPGRIDLSLSFNVPDSSLRRQLIDRWHVDVRAGIDIELAIRQTEGYSFAEIEEVKNLLILRYIEQGGWQWRWAMDQFRTNRKELATEAPRPVGFGTILERSLNGC